LFCVKCVLYITVIISELNYKTLIKDIYGKYIFLDYILRYQYQHTADNESIIIFVRIVGESETYILNFNHQDVPSINMDARHIIDIIVQSAKKVFVMDKKKFLNLFKNKNVEDVLIHQFQEGFEHDENSNLTNFHTFLNYKFGDKLENVNSIIPLSKHIESFNKKYNFYEEYMVDVDDNYSFTQMNGIITETLSEVEQNGIYVDIDIFNENFKDRGISTITSKIYTEYNIFTSTGRPSNTFGKVNYAALNKENGTRSMIISRFGENGMLMSLDYNAYHPHIIANLINFKLDPNVNFYSYIGQFYFNKSILDNDDVSESKSITFKNLYGGIKRQYRNIEYFKKVEEYINHRWNFFTKNGYVETPVFKRKITSQHIKDPNPNKLFNYLLQAAETEFSIKNINNVNRLLEHKLSKVILYTYDSILVDVHRDDGKNTLICIRDTMVDNQFPIKCCIGKDYNKLVKIEL
jgi:hypothetical protein